MRLGDSRISACLPVARASGFGRCGFAFAPLRLCDAREPGAFLNSLPKLFSEEGAFYVVCDWHLEREELAAAVQLKDESQITFLWPRI
jgi:hypothetical protein